MNQTNEQAPVPSTSQNTAEKSTQTLERYKETSEFREYWKYKHYLEAKYGDDIDFATPEESKKLQSLCEKADQILSQCSRNFRDDLFRHNYGKTLIENIVSSTTNPAPEIRLMCQQYLDGEISFIQLHAGCQNMISLDKVKVADKNFAREALISLFQNMSMDSPIQCVYRICQFFEDDDVMTKN